MFDEIDYDDETSSKNKYRIVWVNSDFEIKETTIEAKSKKKSIIEFFTYVDAFEVENFKIKIIE